MNMVTMLFYGALLAAAVLWPVGFLVLCRIPRLKPAADRRRNGDGISVVIPARNEALRLPVLLDSLGTQDPHVLEVLVVDDGSIDGTRRTAEERGARVIAAPPRPDGWLGKSWACWCGAQAARGRFILFLDADVRLLPGAVAALSAEHERRGGVVSVQPYHRVVRAYEHLSAFCNLVVMTGIDSFGACSPFGRPSGCFGPCLFVSRNDYFRAGGHAAVRDELVEDVALGRRFVSCGIGVRNFGGRGAVEFRMYPDGPAALVEGWTKNLARASSLSAPRAVALLALWISGMMACVSLPFFALAAGSAFALPSAAVAYFLYAAALFFQFRRIGNFSPLCALFFPVELLFFLFLFGRSLTRTHLRRRVIWKGRDIKIGEDRKVRD